MTNIQWTDVTSNPIHLVKPDGSHGGHWCKKVSPGCANCYSEAQNNNGFFSFASHLEYVGDAPDNLIFDEEVCKKWLSWRKPKKIFVCSMTDLFGEWVENEWIDKVFGYMASAHWHTFHVLTKRPERAIAYFQRHNLAQSIKDASDLVCKPELPLKNVWFGITCENQAMADKRIPLLLETPAAVKWLSVEPILENIDLKFGSWDVDVDDDTTRSIYVPNENNLVDWVVLGGESGKNARSCHIVWVRSLVRQCQDASIPVFVKQLGSKPLHIQYIEREPKHKYRYKISGNKGGKIQEFPEDLQIREFPAN
ncbi:MAG: DUF5131 family protein [Nostoc sp. ChiSLP01]|nr:DUF5131 family protein [Nostoc sp. CmiSLP01]MDZ8285255.1 DUF5131 family protein [Nostoc sp. ChiSLP01]